MLLLHSGSAPWSGLKSPVASSPSDGMTLVTGLTELLAFFLLEVQFTAEQDLQDSGITFLFSLLFVQNTLGSDTRGSEHALVLTNRNFSSFPLPFCLGWSSPSLLLRF